MHNVYTHIIAEIKKYFKTAGKAKAVIGVSGGVDSALCLKLAVDALGSENVTALMMPEKGISSDENLNHAKKLCQFLEVEHHQISINKFLRDYISMPWQVSPMAHANTKARVRMTVLYNYANTHSALVLGTSNKSELAVGYGTKYGDLAGDIELIGDLLKEEVYELADHVGLPDVFIEKAPSAELYTGQTDEKELGFTYKELDNILKKIDKGETKETILSKGMDPNTVHKIFRLMENSKHKVEPIYTIRKP